MDTPVPNSSISIDAAIRQVQSRIESLLEDSETIMAKPPVPVQEPHETLVGLDVGEVPSIAKIPRPKAVRETDVTEGARQFLNDLLTPQISPPTTMPLPPPEPVLEPCPLAHDPLEWRVLSLIDTVAAVP